MSTATGSTPAKLPTSSGRGSPCLQHNPRPLGEGGGGGCGVCHTPTPRPKAGVTALLPFRGVFFKFSTFLSPDMGALAHAGTQDVSPPGVGTPALGVGRGEKPRLAPLGLVPVPGAQLPLASELQGPHKSRGRARGQRISAELPSNKRPRGAGPGLRVLVTGGTTARGAGTCGVWWGCVGTRGDSPMGSAGMVGPTGGQAMPRA